MPTMRRWVFRALDLLLPSYPVEPWSGEKAISIPSITRVVSYFVASIHGTAHRKLCVTAMLAEPYNDLDSSLGQREHLDNLPRPISLIMLVMQIALILQYVICFGWLSSCKT
jgi:hypothetical protein